MVCEVIISEEAFSALNAVVFYLETNWSKKVAEDFLHNFYSKVDVIANNPHVGRKSVKDPSIRKLLITKHNILYYQVNRNTVELLTIFFTAQNPAKNKLD